MLLFAYASILGLGTACDESGGDHVATLDVMVALAPPRAEPNAVGQILREATMHLCSAGESFEVQILRRGQNEGGTCLAFPVDYVAREGSFPYADLVIDGTAYAANEVHLVHRSNGWFLFIEGNHDQSVMHEHRGVVFQILLRPDTKEPELVLKCSDHIKAWDEDTFELYQCIAEKIQTRGIGLVKWIGDDSCRIDYSICR